MTYNTGRIASSLLCVAEFYLFTCVGGEFAISVKFEIRHGTAVTSSIYMNE